jgi:hypothetical protein
MTAKENACVGGASPVSSGSAVSAGGVQPHRKRARAKVMGGASGFQARVSRMAGGHAHADGDDASVAIRPRRPSPEV